jgi:hypothetical protein
MGTPVNLTVSPNYRGAVQPLELLKNTKTVEDAVRILLDLGKASQSKLVRFMDAIVEHLKSKNIISSYYDPGVKSYESAVRKGKQGYGHDNQVRTLTDPYRASIIVEQKEGIPLISTFIKEHSKDFGFEIVQERDSFQAPWSNGYRDINFRFSDKENQNLVGELQIQLCGIKKFTELAGHKAYEIARTLPKNDPTTPIIKKALESVTQYGYNKSASMVNIGCLEDIKSLHGGKRKQRKTRRSFRKRAHTRKSR